MNLVTANQNQTMTHIQIANLLEKRNDKVKQSMDRLAEKGLIKVTPMGEVNSKGQSFTAYHVNERDSYVVVAQLSPEFTAKLVDYWMESKSNAQPKLPQTFAEALQLAADQAKQLELQAPKVAFVDNLVSRDTLMNTTQVAQKHKMSARKLNEFLDDFKVYNKSVKRGRTFNQWFIDGGYGEMKQTSNGFTQPLFTCAGEIWINEKLYSEGMV